MVATAMKFCRANAWKRMLKSDKLQAVQAELFTTSRRVNLSLETTKRRKKPRKICSHALGIGLYEWCQEAHGISQEQRS